MKRIDRVWSAPRTAPFSGEYPDLYPALTADGSRLCFTSQQPPSPGGHPLPRGQGLLWYVERTAGGWSDPRRLELITDPRSLPSCASVAANGNLFLSMRDVEAPDLPVDIYRARFEGDRYLQPERLRAISSTRPTSARSSPPTRATSSGRPSGGLRTLRSLHQLPDGRRRLERAQEPWASGQLQRETGVPLRHAGWAPPRLQRQPRLRSQPAPDPGRSGDRPLGGRQSAPHTEPLSSRSPVPLTPPSRPARGPPGWPARLGRRSPGAPRCPAPSERPGTPPDRGAQFRRGTPGAL